MCPGTDCGGEAEDAAEAQPCNPNLGECGVPCAGCSIAGECVGAGSVNEDSACQVCDPARSAVAWSNDDDGSCDDGLFCTVEDRCRQGACGGTPRECDDGVACNGVSACNETARACSPPENQCGAGGLCDVGTRACVSACSGCNIGGVCLTSGAEQAGNPCQVCDPGRSSTSYSAAVGKACGAGAGVCSQQDTCDATGNCQPNHLAQGTACGNATSNACNQADTCDGNGACEQRLLANGTPCDDGLFCTVGDQCSGGNCAGAARTCEDGIACNGISQCDEVAARCSPAVDQCGADARCDTATRGCVSTGPCDGEEDSEPLEGVLQMVDFGSADVAPADGGEFRLLATRGTGLFTGILRPGVTDVLLAQFALVTNLQASGSSISAGGGSFATLHREASRGGAFTGFHLLGGNGVVAAGNVLTPTVTPGFGATVFRPTLGDWLVAELASTGLVVGRFSTAGIYTAGGSTAVATGGQLVKVASTSASNSGIVWSNGQSVFLSRVSSTILSPSTAETLGAGGGPDIASVGNDFAVAWATADGFQYRLLSSAGVSRCTPATTSVSFGDGVFGEGDAVALANTPNGVYVLMVDSDGLGLFRMDGSCRVVESAVVTVQAIQPHDPGIAASGSNLALVWSEGFATGTDTLPNSAARVISTNQPLCAQ